MIDIEKFICSLLADHPEGVAVRGDIHRALKEQGLEYKDGKIVPIEDKNELKESEDERIRKGIIRNLEYLMDRAEGFVKDELKERIAWLEKQQKPVISDDALRKGIAHFGITQYQIDNWLKKYVDVEKQSEQKPTERKDFISIPFGTDSELVNETITIPDGCVAAIEGRKIFIRKLKP